MARNVDNNSSPEGDKNNNPNNYYCNLKNNPNVHTNPKVTNRWVRLRLNGTLVGAFLDTSELLLVQGMPGTLA